MYCRAHKIATLTPIQHTVRGGADFWPPRYNSPLPDIQTFRHVPVLYYDPTTISNY